MPQPTTSDWDRLRALCTRAGLPPERIDRLQKAQAGTPSRGATLLLAGAQGTLALLLARWLGLEAANALNAAGTAPLVIGPAPDTVQPPLGRWPTLVRRELGAAHVVAVRSAGALSASLRSALAGLGTFDGAWLVSRLSQPFSAEERQLADSLAPLAATARAVFVALPSEEGSEAERAELAAYGVAQLQAHGFHGRCLGAGVWYTEGDRPAGSIQRLGDWLTARPEEVQAGRSAAGRLALAELLAEIEKAPDRPPETALAQEEVDDLTRKFAGYVGDLGRRLGSLADAGEFADRAACRRFAADTLRGWANRTSLEGMLLDYVESARPGIKAELPSQASAAAELILFEPAARRTSPQRGLLAPGAVRKLGIAAAAALAAFALIYGIGLVFLQGWFTIFLANLGATAAGIAAFAYAGRQAAGAPRDAPAPLEPTTVPGWASAELQLTNWFNGRARSQTPTLRQECAAIRSQFQLEAQHP
jgi:hypothetical protein